MRVSTNYVNPSETVIEIELEVLGPISDETRTEAAKLKDQAGVLAVVITTPGSMVVI